MVKTPTDGETRRLELPKPPRPSDDGKLQPYGCSTMNSIMAVAVTARILGVSNQAAPR